MFFVLLTSSKLRIADDVTNTGRRQREDVMDRVMIHIFGQRDPKIQDTNDAEILEATNVICRITRVGFARQQALAAEARAFLKEALGKHNEPCGATSTGISGGVGAAAAVGAPAVVVSSSESGWWGKVPPKAKRPKSTSNESAKRVTVDSIPDGGTGVATGWGDWTYRDDQMEDVTKWKKAIRESWSA